MFVELRQDILNGSSIQANNGTQFCLSFLFNDDSMGSAMRDASYL
jgi:hypothetical protein